MSDLTTVAEQRLDGDLVADAGHAREVTRAVGRILMLVLPRHVAG
jgi:hypothetical protein